jgi:acetoin utilization deacetylase AcuC-like enzyme
VKTGFISTKSSLNHDTGDEHPENKRRIVSILERLKKKISLISYGVSQISLMSLISKKLIIVSILMM